MQVKELGHIVLYVSNVVASANFYRDILGFREISRDHQVALFSGGRTHHELLLIEIGKMPRLKNQLETGLYHIGFKIGDSAEELQAAYKELVAKGVRVVGATDHNVTHSLYILDPDGNELELYADVSDIWKTDPLSVLAPPKVLHLEV